MWQPPNIATILLQNSSLLTATIVYLFVSFLYCAFLRPFSLSPFKWPFTRWIWVSRYQNVSILDLLELRTMDVVVTIGAISHAKLQWNHHYQQTNIQFFTGRMPLLSPNQQCQEHWMETFYDSLHCLKSCDWHLDKNALLLSLLLLLLLLDFSNG